MNEDDDNLVDALFPAPKPRKGALANLLVNIGTSFLGLPARLHNLVSNVSNVVTGVIPLSTKVAYKADLLATKAAIHGDISPSTYATLNAVKSSVVNSGRSIDRTLTGTADMGDVISIALSAIPTSGDIKMIADFQEFENQFSGLKNPHDKKGIIK